MRNIFFVILSLINLSQVQAQSSVSVLRDFMGEVRNGSHEAVPQTLLENQNNGMNLIEALRPYLKDSMNVVRSKAYYILSETGKKSGEDEVRDAAIKLLIKGIEDQNSGISGSVTNSLKNYSKEHFTIAHEEALGRLLVPETFHLEDVIKLAGYVGNSSYANKLNSIIATTNNFSNKWAARLALARMGDQDAIGYIISKISKAPVNDDFVYDIVPELIYTRRPEIFEFLETIIHSSEANCLSADPDASDQILCGYRVMEYLAPVIKEYPLPVDEFGSLEVDDYQKALEDVRSWLKANDYTIITETY